MGASDDLALFWNIALQDGPMTPISSSQIYIKMLSKATVRTNYQDPEINSSHDQQTYYFPKSKQ
jgi:hypothetical protein